MFAINERYSIITTTFLTFLKFIELNIFNVCLSSTCLLALLSSVLLCKLLMKKISKRVKLL